MAAITLSPLSSCDRLDDDRIPVTPVNITFQTQADWDIYGVPGALSWKRFIRELRQPANFPYTEMTYTGFGGILLVCDVLGTPQAYDLACPVERSRDVRVNIDPKDEYLAVCPKCGSRNLTKIDRMNGYLSYSRVHGDTRLNDAKMAEIAERKSM